VETTSITNLSTDGDGEGEERKSYAPILAIWLGLTTSFGFSRHYGAINDVYGLFRSRLRECFLFEFAHF